MDEADAQRGRRRARSATGKAGNRRSLPPPARGGDGRHRRQTTDPRLPRTRRRSKRAVGGACVGRAAVPGRDGRPSVAARGRLRPRQEAAQVPGRSARRRGRTPTRPRPAAASRGEAWRRRVAALQCRPEWRAARGRDGVGRLLVFAAASGGRREVARGRLSAAAGGPPLRPRRELRREAARCGGGRRPVDPLCRADQGRCAPARAVPLPFERSLYISPRMRFNRPDSCSVRRRVSRPNRLLTPLALP